MGKHENLYTYGEIIHNPQVVANFKEKGVLPIEDPGEAQAGAVIIRSHGAPEEKIEQFRQKKLTIIDATCPFVRRIQKIVQKALQKGEFIVIIGESKHPEVIGINGHCQNTAAAGYGKFGLCSSADDYQKAIV